MKNKLIKLMDVKSITTLSLLATFIYLTIAGKIQTELFMPVFMTVFGSFMGMQTSKNIKEGDQNGSKK